MREKTSTNELNGNETDLLVSLFNSTQYSLGYYTRRNIGCYCTLLRLFPVADDIFITHFVHALKSLVHTSEYGVTYCVIDFGGIFT